MQFSSDPRLCLSFQREAEAMGPTPLSSTSVMLALILVACITIVTTLGKSVSGTFSKVNNAMS